MKSFCSFAPSMSEINEQKQKIAQAAAALFMKYGIKSVSMDDIATSIGISKKTIYQSFKNKGELVKDVVASIIRYNEETCRRDHKRSENAVHEGFLAMVKVTELYQNMNINVLYEMQKYYPAVYKIFSSFRREFLYRIIKDNFLRGIDEGLFRKDINIDIAAKFRVESMLIPFTPDFYDNLNVSIAEANDEVFLLYLNSMVTAKGARLIEKYKKQKIYEAD